MRAGASTSSTTTAAGCGGFSTRSATLSLRVDGFTRTVIVHVPKKDTNIAERPLVLNLHGSGSTVLEQEEFTGMDRTANADGFIVAYPQALIPDGTGFDWNVPGVPLIGGRAVPAKAANDVKFLTRLVGILEQKYCIDPKQVYATGFSGGARETSQLACDDSPPFAAIAPVSGVRHPSPCPTSRPVPVIAFHGSADPIDPLAGNGQPYWTYSVKAAAEGWAAQDRCSKEKTSKPTRDVILSTYGDCAGGVDVELYEVIGEGHEWPAGPALPPAVTSLLGAQSNAINANQLIWSFFRRYPLP